MIIFWGGMLLSWLTIGYILGWDVAQLADHWVYSGVGCCSVGWPLGIFWGGMLLSWLTIGYILGWDVAQLADHWVYSGVGCCSVGWPLGIFWGGMLLSWLTIGYILGWDVAQLADHWVYSGVGCCSVGWPLGIFWGGMLLSWLTIGYILGWDVAQLADHWVYSGIFPSETASMQTALAASVQTLFCIWLLYIDTSEQSPVLTAARTLKIPSTGSHVIYITIDIVCTHKKCSTRSVNLWRWSVVAHVTAEQLLLLIAFI